MFLLIILYFLQIANDLQPTLSDLRARYLREKKTIQPFIIAVGAVSHISNYYVVLNDKLFEVTDILNAVELALKFFFSLDCNYPENAQIIWVFLQKALFDIHLDFDVISIDSNIILGHIKKITT